MGLTSSHLKSCWIWWFATVSQRHQVVCTRLNTPSCFTASRPHAGVVRVIFSLIFPPWHKLLPLNNQGGLAAHNYLSKYSWSARCQHDYFTAPLSRPEPPQSRVVKARLVWYLPIARLPPASDRRPTTERKTRRRQRALATYFWLQTCGICSFRLGFHCCFGCKKDAFSPLIKSLCAWLYHGDATVERPIKARGKRESTICYV